jgi:hypothetical protein
MDIKIIRADLKLINLVRNIVSMKLGKREAAVRAVIHLIMLHPILSQLLQLHDIE